MLIPYPGSNIELKLNPLLIDSNLLLYLSKKCNNFQIYEIYGHLLVVLVKLNWGEFLFLKHCRIVVYWILNPRSGIQDGKNPDSGSGTNIPDPQRCNNIN
jgi:hypothetical protein